MQVSNGSNQPSPKVVATGSGALRQKAENKSCIELINSKIEKKEVFWSFEYFPPKTEIGKRS